MSKDDDWVIWDSNPRAHYPLCVFAQHHGACGRWIGLHQLQAGYRPHGTTREHVDWYIRHPNHGRHTGTRSVVRLPDALALLNMRLAREAAGT